MLLQSAHQIADILADLLELLGVAIIIAGVILATILFVRSGLNGQGWQVAYEQYRSNIGRGILLGLEFLVGADIITTITAPLTAESVALLGALIAIRTFLSFALETEIEGCWPWQRARLHGNRRHVHKHDRA
jgi:uncharacterized membrane protein